MKGAPTDGGRARIPDLRRKGAAGRDEVASTNALKSSWLVDEFYPKRGVGARDPDPDTVYPEPLWEDVPLTESVLHEVITKMKPWKATRSRSLPNCVYKFCAALIVPRLQRIYRALDIYRCEPLDWKITETIVGRKPGKPDYSKPGAHRPLILSHGHARVRNAGKCLVLTSHAERLGMLPVNHYGG
ncbi:hypothetical protein B0H15DRAFT_784932, partial [Mycena belliarum]